MDHINCSATEERNRGGDDYINMYTLIKLVLLFSFSRFHIKARTKDAQFLLDSCLNWKEIKCNIMIISKGT